MKEMERRILARKFDREFFDLENIEESEIFSELKKLRNRIRVSVADEGENIKKQFSYSFFRTVCKFEDVVSYLLFRQGKMISYETFDDNSNEKFLDPIRTLYEVSDGSSEGKKEELLLIACDMLATLSKIAAISRSRKGEEMLKVTFSFYLGDINYDVANIVKLIRCIINEDK